MRGYVVNGPTLVKVQNDRIGQGQELGLTNKDGLITIRPRFKHADLRVDDYGPEIPPEVMWQLADAIITMTLIHWDYQLLDKVIAESCAGGTEGTMQGAGSLMGNLKAIGAEGNHFITLGLLTQTEGGRVWRFPASYLAEDPMTLPIGVKASRLRLTFRAIPYKAPVPVGSVFQTTEVISQGAILWDRAAI